MSTYTHVATIKSSDENHKIVITRREFDAIDTILSFAFAGGTKYCIEKDGKHMQTVDTKEDAIALAVEMTK